MSESFREEITRLRKEQGSRYGAIKRAFAKSPAIIVTTGGRRELLIKSGETRRGGKPLRVTTFMVDGPWGHSEYGSDDEIYQELSRSPFDDVRAACDDDVTAWTSTPEFVRGAAAVAMIQAENTLRYLASKHAAHDELAPTFAKARELAGPQTREAFDAAAAILEAAIARYPHPNPSGIFEPNPAWVTKAIASSMDTINDQVPPKWHPRLSKARARRGDLVARMKEYGCGAYGCVLPTLEAETVLKVTTDVTEAQFAKDIAATLVVPIVVDYRLVMQIKERYKKSPVFLLWRESALDVGKLEKHPLIATQHRAAQIAYEEMYRSGTTSRGAIGAWRTAIRQMGTDPELRYLSTGMLRVFDEQGVFFGDVHGGNVGRCARGEKLEWVIIDPGHVSVVKK